MEYCACHNDATDFRWLPKKRVLPKNASCCCSSIVAVSLFFSSAMDQMKTECEIAFKTYHSLASHFSRVFIDVESATERTKSTDRIIDSACELLLASAKKQRITTGDF